MKTVKLYQQNVYKRNWNATLTAIYTLDKFNLDFSHLTDLIHKEDNFYSFIICLDKTAFFPIGGGQSSDIGFINEFFVKEVFEDNENIYHHILIPKDSNYIDKSLKTGDNVICNLNWEHRFDNMQRHCGEHILSGVLYDLYGGVNRGFHMGDDYMTIDILLEDNPLFTELNMSLLLDAELKANNIIYDNLPIHTKYFDNIDEANNIPLRKSLTLEKDISIVTIGSVENPADSVACCGTHPSSSSEVGIIKIYKMEKNKKMFRIYFEAGRRALDDYRLKHDILTTLSTKYSTTYNKLPKLLESHEEKASLLKNELIALKKDLINKETASIKKILDNYKYPLFYYELNMLPLDDVFSISKDFIGKTNKILLLFAVKHNSFVIVSDGEMNSNEIVKENAKLFNGNGGGSNLAARAIFNTKKDALMFKEHLENLL